MKDDILKRAMFAMPLSKEAKNSGILAGFDLDEMDDMEEMPEPSEEMPQMSRTPQNPEILMNNLRGDMRSVDARYMELAQLVGEEAAMETPPEVLAMLQSQLAQQGAGIGALPQAQGMMPPGMPAQQPPQGLPATMPPGMEGAAPFSPGAGEAAPEGFAEGGAVTGNGFLNLQVPLNLGGGDMGFPAAGMSGPATTALQQGYGGAPAQPPLGISQQAMVDQQMAPAAGVMKNGVMTNVMSGIDQNAVRANPQAFQSFMQQMQGRERAVPNSTMLSPLSGPLFSSLRFAEGGMVDAPETEDGMPPMYAQAGAFVTPITRLAQMGADKLGPLATQANALGGQFLSRGLPQQFPAILENVRGPGGRFTAEQLLKYPTLTEHLSNFVGPTASRIAQGAGAMVPPALATAAGAVTASGIYKSMFGDSPDPEREALLKAYEEAYYARMGDRSIPMPPLGNKTNDEIKADILQITSKAGAYAPTSNRPPISAAAMAQGRVPMTASMSPTSTYARSGAGAGEEAAYLASKNAPAPAPAVAAAADAAPPDTMGEFIQKKLVKPGEGTETSKSRIDRVRELQKEYAPLYRELLGDTQDDMYRNAMLLIADAGLKYASAPAKSGTTLVSRLAESTQGLPQGFMALMAQAKDRQLKVDTAVLSQAVNDVQEQDKIAQQMRMEILKGDYRLLLEQVKNTGGGTLEDGGAGLLISKGPKGSFAGVSIDPKNPTVQTALNSRWTLRDTDNPFVVNRGEAPTAVETDKGERVKLTNSLRSLDNSLSTLDNLKGVYTQAYGPGAWFTDKVNNILVPILPSAVVRPDVNLVDASTRISTGMNSILKNIASANDSGRVAVQEQEWARDTAKGVTDPTRFFTDKELVAKQLNSMEAMLRNARQQLLTQLGYENKDYVMSTPSTGTQSDPFVVPTDPNEQKRMFNFLGSTIGKIQDPRATVYIRMPNGSIQSFNPTQLQGLLK